MQVLSLMQSKDQSKDDNAGMGTNLVVSLLDLTFYEVSGAVLCLGCSRACIKIKARYRSIYRSRQA